MTSLGYLILKNKDSIENVDIGKNKFTHTGLIVLATLLRTNVSFKKLCISRNRMISKQAFKIPFKLIHYGTVEMIDTRRCGNHAWDNFYDIQRGMKKGNLSVLSFVGK